MELYFTYHKIHLFQMYNLVILVTLSSGATTIINYLEHFHSPSKISDACL